MLFLRGSVFFWELATLIDIMLLGHYLEMRSVRRAAGALDSLARLLPDTAERLDGQGVPEPVHLSELRAGDLVLVRPGQSAGGRQSSPGESDVNESMITGESMPVRKGPDDRSPAER